MAFHVGNVTRVAKGGMLKKHVVRTLRDGTIEEEKEWALPDWRASAFLLERQAPAEFGKRQTLALSASDSIEPTVEGARAAGGDVGGALGQSGIERLVTNLQAWAASRPEPAELEAGPDDGSAPVDAEVMDEDAG
ncbi:hypothetical protein [Phycicoccus sp.]|uniref:hypothetical protein n=1 Tax=Phycicoccus sp. TaxID=1902410 RepID=UPI002B7093AB|nr:hypothetical protein [Phycicoccus sp.]HMM95291.1 hypothetical protein [Phycicoccus sp.]